MSDADILEQCIVAAGNTTAEDLLRCVFSSRPLLATGEPFSIDSTDRQGYSRHVMLVFSAALVIFMQAGFAMLVAGSVREKNVQNTMLKNMLDSCGAAVGFFAVGYAFAFGGQDAESPDKTFIGSSSFFLANVDDNDWAFWLYQYACSATAATIVAGTLAERCQMGAYLGYSVLLGGFVYPVIAHSVWSYQGFLSSRSLDPLWGSGMIDFAGSAVVHMTGGITALYATAILGPRRGRFYDEDGEKLVAPAEFPGHSVALQMLGAFTLWFGWYGFNAGSALLLDSPDGDTVLALTGVNTTLAGGTGGIVALFAHLALLEHFTGEPVFDVNYLMNGTLSGLVAITACCGLVEPWAAVVIGAVAGLLYMAGSWALIRFCIDDVVNAIPVHLVNGAWGAIATGLFATPTRLQNAYENSDHVGFFYSFSHGGADATLLSCQLVGILFILGWVTATMFPFFYALAVKGWFRSDPLEEIVGLDRSYHGGQTLLTKDDSVRQEHLTEFIHRRQLERSNHSKHKSADMSSHSSSLDTSRHGRHSSPELPRSELDRSYHGKQNVLVPHTSDATKTTVDEEKTDVDSRASSPPPK